MQAPPVTDPPVTDVQAPPGPRSITDPRTSPSLPAVGAAPMRCGRNCSAAPRRALAPGLRGCRADETVANFIRRRIGPQGPALTRPGRPEGPTARANRMARPEDRNHRRTARKHQDGLRRRRGGKGACRRILPHRSGPPLPTPSESGRALPRAESFAEAESPARRSRAASRGRRAAGPRRIPPPTRPSPLPGRSPALCG